MQTLNHSGKNVGWICVIHEAFINVILSLKSYVFICWLPIMLQIHRIKLSSNLATESLWPQCSDYLAGAPLSEWVRARMVAIKNVHAQTSLSSRRPHRMWMSKRDPKK